MAPKDEIDNAEQGGGGGGGGNDLAHARSTAAGSLLEEHDQLERGLHSRHIQFMALGGA